MLLAAAAVATHGEAADFDCATFDATSFDRAYEDVRKRERLPRVQASSRLTLGASRYAGVLAEFDHFDHVGPFGSTLPQRVEEAGYCYRMVSENLALGAFSGASALLDAWMNSPGHRKNLLDSRSEEYGLASACHAGMKGPASAPPPESSGSLAELLASSDRLAKSVKAPTPSKTVPVFVMIMGAPCAR